MKILVIEDDPDLCELLVSMLEDQGYEVDFAADGINGLDRALEWNCDAIVLDIMLPGIDGFEILRQLRRFKKTPVLMLTARDGTIDRVSGLDLGADDYLTKPFENTELLARLRALLRRSGISPRQIITIGNVQLDCASKVAQVEGEDVDLTIREFELAEMLARKRGTVVSRDFLFEHMFNNDELSPNLLDVYIYKLRRKLGSDFIRTRRGSGYIVD